MLVNSNGLKPGLLRCILVDVNADEIKEVQCEDKLESFYKLLGCDFIDIQERKIGNFLYDVICDDEGLLKNGCKISAFDKNFEPMFVGNLLLVNYDEEGNTQSLSQEQIGDVKKYTITIIDKNGVRKCLKDVQYREY